MQKCKDLAFLLMVFLACACGKTNKDHAPWPATISFAALKESEQVAVTDTLKGFSKSLGTDVFFFDNTPSHFQIVISLLSTEDKNSSKAGLATYNGTFCKVELNESVFSASYSSYLEPVLWHELGHCAGMDHDPKLGELMYYLASPKSFYSVDAISRFMEMFKSLTSLVEK